MISDNKAGFKFVVPTTSGKWQSKPTFERGQGQVDLGTFDTPVEAAVAAARALREYKESQALPAKEKRPRGPKGCTRERYTHTRLRRPHPFTSAHTC